MTKKEFIASFPDAVKLNMMNTLLGEIFDDIKTRQSSPEEIIKRHLQDYKENISCDTRIVEILRNSEIARLKERLVKLKLYAYIDETSEIFFKSEAIMRLFKNRIDKKFFNEQ